MFRYFVFSLLLAITSLPSISTLKCLQCASFGFVSTLWIIFDCILWIVFERRGSSEGCDAGTIEATECTKGDVCVSYYLRSPHFKIKSNWFLPPPATPLNGRIPWLMFWNPLLGWQWFRPNHFNRRSVNSWYLSLSDWQKPWHVIASPQTSNLLSLFIQKFNVK